MPRKKLLIDADVLIDYLGSDIFVLRHVKFHVGDIFTINQVFKEVGGLDIQTCQQVGLEILVPDKRIEKMAEQKIGQLSKNDKLILFTAKEHGAEVVTNDSHLRLTCLNYEIKVLRGLRLLIELIEKSDYPIDNMIKIVENICENNQLYINHRIVDRFIKIVKNIRG